MAPLAGNDAFAGSYLIKGIFIFIYRNDASWRAMTPSAEFL